MAPCNADRDGTHDTNQRNRRRQQTVAPVFDFITSVLGVTHFRRRCLPKIATAWTLIAIADTCRRFHRIRFP